MFKEHSTIVRRIVIGGDLALLGASFLLAFLLRFDRLPRNSAELWKYGWVALLFIPILLFNLYRAELYHKIRYLSFWQILRRLIFGFVMAAAVAAAALFLSHAVDYSRLLFIYFAGIAAISMVTAKLGGKYFLHLIRLRGMNYRNVLLVGCGPKLKKLEEIFRPGNPYGVKIAKVVKIDQESPDEFAQRLTGKVIDDIYFAIPRGSHKFCIDPFLEQVEAVGKTSKIMLNITENRSSKCDFSRLEGLPLVVLYPVTLDPDKLLLKRLIDLVGATVGVGINLLLFPFIALAIKLDSPGPIFFCQTRVGENGRHFSLYKYRSMSQDAEARKQELMTQNELNGAVFKLTNDPRVTRVGNFLRKTSLDELPQFWNVLVGNMSLVGTRPPTPDEVKVYDLHHHRRLSIKPGITGLWQVSGRNKISNFDEIVKLDTEYIDQWSLWLDCKILSKTLMVIWSGK